MRTDGPTRTGGTRRGRGALAERDRLLVLLDDFTQALAAAPDVKGICTSAFDVLHRLLDWRIGIVYLHSEGAEGRLVMVHGRNVPPDVAEQLRTLPLDESTQSGAAALRGELVVSRRAAYPFPRFAGLVEEKSFTGIVSLPLAVRDRLVGVLTVFTVGNAEDDVPDWLRPGLGTIGRALALALSNARLFDDLAEARSQISRGYAEIDDFTYVLGHDIKEPLRTLHAYCSTLAADFGDALDESGTALVANIINSADYLQRLVDDLRKLAGAHRDRGPTVDLDMEALVHRAVAPFADIARERHAEIRVLRPLPRARGDVGGVEVVVQNLVSNGLKFNESGTPRVEIGHAADKRSTGGRQDRPDRRGCHTYFVRDNGLGIPPTQHDAVFAPFLRLQPRDAYGGTGAGLAIARRIVEANGGRIWVESEAGAGATFYFTLPAASEELGG